MFGTGPMVPMFSPPHEKSLKRPSTETSSHRGGRSYKPNFNQHGKSFSFLSLAITAESPMGKGKEGVQEAQSDHHERSQSLQVHWAVEDVERMAKEIYAGTIADVHLSLLGYWIRTCSSNYEIAKAYIRELGLDQGYNTARIGNPNVRKLLADTHHVRPREPPHAVNAKVQLKALTNSMKSKSLGNIPSAAAMPGILFPPFRLKNRTMQLPSQPDSDDAEGSLYPPNTPDRPAPLSIRSRSSNASKASLSTSNIVRSASTPFRSRNLISLPLPRASVIFQDTVSHPLLSPSNGPSTAIQSRAGTTSGDIFGLVSRGNDNHSDPLIHPQISYNYQSKDSSKGDMHSEPSNCDGLGLFQLADSDVASDTSNGTSDQDLMDLNPAVTKNDVKEACSSSVRKASLGTLRSYVESDYELSILESASNGSEHENQSFYKYATSFSRPEIDSNISHYSSMDQTCPEPQRLDHSAPAVTHHLPLPPSSYEIETQLNFDFQSFNIQAPSETRRPSRSHHGVFSSLKPAHHSSAIRLPSRTASVTGERGELVDSRSYNGMQTEQYLDCVGFNNSPHHGSSRKARTTGLTAFPIPPMRNPVGELPMLISRAASPFSSPELPTTTPPLSAPSSQSVAEAYRAITKVHMVNLLKKTRSRGAKLPRVDWNSLSSLETGWREDNEHLLVSIYGAQDVVLTHHDVEYVNCIAQELCSGGDGISSNDWVLRMFKGDI